MNVADAAYAAGLFDGEGHVEYKKRLVKQKKGKNNGKIKRKTRNRRKGR